DQIETWVYAWVAQDKPLLEFKKTGDYLYGVFWDEWQISPGKPFFIPGKPHQKAFINPAIEPREILAIKRAPLGLQYGRGVDSLLEYGFSRQRAAELREKYFRDHRAIAEHHTRRLQDA